MNSRFRSRSGQAGAQALEPRVLLSAGVKAMPSATLSLGKHVGLTQPFVTHQRSNVGKSGKSGSAITSATTGTSTYQGGNLTPEMLRDAYGVNQINFNGITGDGTGQTIAILDPGDDPGFVDSTSSSFGTSDLAIFDSAFGLPNPPSFTKMGFTVTNTPQLTSTLPAAASDNEETALDVEWAHAMAPQANILLVEGPADFSNILDGVLAIDAAASSMQIVAVSMSFSGPESGFVSGTQNAEGVDGRYFDTPGLVYLAATGDYGAYGNTTATNTTLVPQYPADSSNVLAVGGTTLSVNNYSYAGESTWGNGTASGTSNGGGGGLSLYEPQPAYQVGKVNGLTTTSRAYPDISMDANPASGVPIYDSPDFGVGTGWSPKTYGGTSLATPLMAGLIAIADQGRSLQGLALLASSGGAGVAASNPNGNPAADDVHTLLYGLGYGNSDFHDITTGSSIGPSSYGPRTGYDLSTGLGSPVANNLVIDLSGISSTPAVDRPAITNLYLTEANGDDLAVWANSSTPGSGTPTAVYPLADISSIDDAPASGNDVLTLDYSNGDFTAGFRNQVASTLVATSAPPAAPIIYIGAGSLNDITIIGTSGDDTLNATATSLTSSGGLGTAAIALSNVQEIQFPGGSGGSDTLNVTASPTGGYIVNADAAAAAANVTVNLTGSGTGVLFEATQHLAGLTIGTGATATLTASATPGGTVLVTGGLVVGGTGRLDLTNNAVVVNYAPGNDPLATLAAEIGSAYNGGGASAWTGSGITSSLANAGQYGIGYGEASQILGASGGTFLGQAVSGNAVLIRYTRYGDANLDGTVNFSDLLAVAQNYSGIGTTWSQGDFNYDGTTNFADLLLLSQNYNATI